MITREHGSWAVFGVPLLLAGVQGGSVSANLMLFGVSAVAVFMSYVPLRILLGRGKSLRPDERRRAVRWAAVYLGAGLAAAIPLLLDGRWLLAAFGAAGASLFYVNHLLTRQAPKTVPGDLAAVAGLTLTAPAGMYVTTGTIGAEAWLLWLLCFAFFAGAVLHVHMKIAARQQTDDPLPMTTRLRLGTKNLLFQGSTVSSIGALAAADVLPWGTLAAYAPMAAQAVYGTVRLHRETTFKRLGFSLLGQSLLFGFALALTLR